MRLVPSRCTTALGQVERRDLTRADSPRTSSPISSEEAPIPSDIERRNPGELAPSIGSLVPLMNDAASEQSHTTARATSSGRPIRRIGIALAA